MFPFRFALVALAVVCAFHAPAQDLERKVSGQTIVSESLPAAKLTFATEFRYAGGQRFPLYGVADAEQHFFVDADSAGKIRRMYWVQFERYLPSNTKTYRHEVVRSADFGPLSFSHDTRLFRDQAAVIPSPDSDSARAKTLLEKAGFEYPVSGARIRMFHFPGTDRRSELMIIYMEMAAADQLPAGLTNGASADEKYPEWSARMLQRAKECLTVTTR